MDKSSAACTQSRVRGGRLPAGTATGAAGAPLRVRYASCLPSGDHSYALTPSGAAVNARDAPPEGPTENTWGRSPATPRNERRVPSGDQRSRGAGSAGTKRRASSASRVGAPPVTGTTKSRVSCVFAVSEGDETV